MKPRQIHRERKSAVKHRKRDLQTTQPILIHPLFRLKNKNLPAIARARYVVAVLEQEKVVMMPRRPASRHRRGMMPLISMVRHDHVHLQNNFIKADKLKRWKVHCL